MRSIHPSFLALLACSLVAIAPLHADARVHIKDAPEHLLWAELLVETTPAAHNDYGEPSTVRWKGDNGKKTSSNNTKCGSLVSQLLQRAYEPDLQSWFGCNSPNAKTYHDRIADEDGFDLIGSIADVQPGDVVAIEYLDMGCKNHTCGTVEGCVSSGHTAIVAARPILRTATAPLVADTLQYSLEIIDSSSSFHGTDDTRYQSEADHSNDRGVGRGTMRLYVDAKEPGRPVIGYSWSLDADSAFKTADTRHLVIGRYAQ